MISIPLTAVLALAAAPAGAREPAALPSLTLELEAREAAAATGPWRPPAQGVHNPPKARGFVSIGGHVTDGDVRSPTGDDPDEDEAFSLDLGLYTWNANLGLALELGAMVSSYEVDVSTLASDDVDVTRYFLGLRFLDDEPDSLFLYHLRGGLVYREDDGDVIDDDGTGWYLGGGFEWRLPVGFSVGPQVLYADHGSVGATEWIFGLQATYAF